MNTARETQEKKQKLAAYITNYILRINYMIHKIKKKLDTERERTHLDLRQMYDTQLFVTIKPVFVHTWNFIGKRHGAVIFLNKHLCKVNQLIDSYMQLIPTNQVNKISIAVINGERECSYKIFSLNSARSWDIFFQNALTYLYYAKGYLRAVEKNKHDKKPNNKPTIYI